MRNFFENEDGTIIPFNHVIKVMISPRYGDLCVYTSIDIEPGNYTVFPIDQLEAYKLWLTLQDKKEGTVNSSENPNSSEHIDINLEDVTPVITKDQVRKIFRQNQDYCRCEDCALRYLECNYCVEEYDPTNEFVEKINKVLEAQWNLQRKIKYM